MRLIELGLGDKGTVGFSTGPGKSPVWGPGGKGPREIYIFGLDGAP